MSSSELPIACTLTNSELQERRTVILQKAGRAVLEMKELEDGYAYRFPADDDWMMELTHIVLLERQCCRFLDFKIIVAAGGDSIWLEMSGPPGTKEFLASFLH